MQSLIARILMILAAVRITFIYDGAGIFPYLIGIALFYAGLHFAKDRKTILYGTLSSIVVFVLGSCGGLVEILDGGFDPEYVNLWHCAVAFLFFFAAITKRSTIIVPIANNDTQLHKSHCWRYKVAPEDVQFCFMTKYNDKYIAIGHNDVIYSHYYDNGVSNVVQVKIKNISGYEKFGTGSVLNGVRIFCNGGPRSYTFTMGQQDQFIACLDYILANPVSKVEQQIQAGTCRIEEIFNRFDYLCSLGGVNPNIYKNGYYEDEEDTDNEE